ncbi:ATP-binding protein [Salinibacillus xinjiangensis]|uniref:ATP-binding protein n=1 Tax=Salinibacillus xinjiangensis TaxID=1229268 RepID=A0A6G1X231_9BACI|nr:ATP-binding protein [Salinibacillus xinjiangensis]MRG85043.1 ATP-binding protein [Salinibacillus xinjiangensis]
MKRLIPKFLHHKKEEQKPSHLLPPIGQLNSFQDLHDRALIGWIVYQLAEVTDMEQEQRETIFYQSFSSQSFEEIHDETFRYLCQLAKLGVLWLKNNLVIEEEMKALDLPKEYQEHFTRLLSEIHTETIIQSVQKDEDQKIWEVYRDVIYAATHGSFLLIEIEKVKDYKQGKLLCEVMIQERGDIPKARQFAKDTFAEVGLKSSKIMSYNLIISEAVTNILKHAGQGKMLIYKNDEEFRVVVEDEGPGFPLQILPKTTLMAGFSTKESLGQGFTLMMKMAKQVLLGTSPEGSTLILVLDGKGEEKSGL